MNLLLLSNSTNAGEEYLQYAGERIRDFLGPKRVKALFIPYAGVTVTFSDYEQKVKEKFSLIGHDIVSIHRFDDPVKAVEEAEAIVVGGGNTFRLVQLLHKNRLIDVIRERVLEGKPYIGWSAGANVACPTICTTNDMPVVKPESFDAFSLVRFQINPHYLDANPDGHAGETREMRISEYTELNRDKFVVGIREGSMLAVENGNIRLLGPHKMRLFRYGNRPIELGSDDDCSFLL
jgi:dipeptidase E